MWITFQCSNCETRLEIDAADVGSRVECPTCRTSLVVPRRGLGAGTTVGNFKIEKLLGRGGMGEVYLARQISMDRMVALKILPPALANDRGTAERFLEEVRLTARLEHPHLVTAFEAGEDSGVLYMAMAYIAGPTLHDLVRERGPLGERDALLIARKLAGALAYAWNEHQLLHRDIKPSNVLVDPRGEPRLADLGLAKSLARSGGLTLSGTLLGTPNYMSPEQAQGADRIDTRADMYSLGATLYTAVTGRIPYESTSLVDTLRKLGVEPLPDPRNFNPSLSEACVGILGLMLAPDPRNRPATWEILIAEMDRVLAGLGVQSHDLPAVRAPRRAPAWRKPALAVAGILAAGGLGVWVALAWMNREDGSAVATDSNGPAPTNATAAARPAGAGGDAAAVSSAAPTGTVAATPGAVEVPELPAGMQGPGPGGKLFQEARDYAAAHPEDPDGVIARFKRVMEEAPGSGAARKAREFLDQGLRFRQFAIDRAKDRMRRGTEEALRAGRPEAVMERLQMTSDGPLHAELEPLRQELLARLRKARDEAAAKKVADALDAAFSSAVQDLLRLDMTGGRRRLTEAKAVPELVGSAAELDGAVALLDESLRLNAVIVESFAADRGREVDIGFRDGHTNRLTIVSADAKGMTGRRKLPQGSIDRDFTVGELSPAEKLRRLGTDASPARCLMRAWIDLEAGQKAAARVNFERAGGRLGAALAAALAAS